MANTIKGMKIKSPANAHQNRTVDKFLKHEDGQIAAHGTGTGKTFTSILAATKAGNPVEFIGPAPLVSNYRKELKKHLGSIPKDVNMRSFEKVLRNPKFKANSTLIVDEAQRLRGSDSKKYKILMENMPAFKKKLFLTASPMYNSPQDLGALVNLMKGKKVLPDNTKDFDAQFVKKTKVSPGFIGKLMGVKPGVKKEMKNKSEFMKAVKGVVDVYNKPSDSADFPTVTNTTHTTEMQKKQWGLYRYVMNQAPWWVRYKIKNKLPMDSKEQGQLNAFLTATRQISNSAGTYAHGAIKEPSAKMELMVKHLRTGQKKNPNHKAIVYSNFLGSLDEYSSYLDEHGIPYAKFTGKESKAVKTKVLKDYNEGKIKTLLVSSSGVEGLDTKGTREIQVMEPHFNKEKIRQIIGRGVRFKSHADLPEAERRVQVRRYHATAPKRGLVERMIRGKAPATVDQYLHDHAEKKDGLNQEFMKAVEKANE